MSETCLTVISKLNNAIDDANNTLINNMTDSNVNYESLCVKPNITYDFYYQYLKKKWDEIIDNFIDDPNKCTDKVSEFINFYKFMSSDKISKTKQLLNISNTDKNSLAKNMSNTSIDDIILENIANWITESDTNDRFSLKENFIESVTDLSKIMLKYCQCQLPAIFRTFVKKYKTKYGKKYRDKTQNEKIQMLRNDFDKFKLQLVKISKTGILPNQYMITDKISNQLTGLFSFSVENELDKLIPNELGSLKDFFVRVISKYYNNLHPVIWAQIFKSMTENVFVDLPFTPNEIFSFGSKYLLLNSGPFILKILQMIRPVLKPELAAKYNITKLTYPLLKQNQVQNILDKVVYDWDMYRILANFSASVGHVSKVVRSDRPTNEFMIKIIKPLAVAQSCWEYATLYDIYPDGTCEQAFIKNMLESNGRELNLNNEIENIKKGHEYYTATYDEVYGHNVDAKLTTVENIPGVIVPNTWFALAMTLAPGTPLNKLVENDLIMKDTIYRAKLHRCLDILVYKFFLSIIQHGFYHGDLHAGNIFFSFEQNQMTLIDFGAVGEINIYSDDPDIRTVLDVIIMSMFYNYEDMFDTMTSLLNSKCVETQINPKSDEYIELKKRLIHYRIQNILNEKREKEKSQEYKDHIFSDERIASEKAKEKSIIKNRTFDANNNKSIYSILEYKPVTAETIVENRDELPVMTNISESSSISFTDVLEEIIKFYALSGVNIAIKFNELYEFQKAYALLLGVLHKVGYNSYRANIAVHRAIVTWENIPELFHIRTVEHFVNSYRDQRNKYKEFKKKLSAHLKPNTLITQKGGNNDIYYQKYLKYKTKYMKLMTEL
jgi:hypothetical protein